MRLTVFDFETWNEGPVDPEKAEVIELTAVMYCMERMIPLDVHTRLYENKAPDDCFFFKETGVTRKDTEFYGDLQSDLREGIVRTIYQSDMIAGHNILKFDCIIVDRLLTESSLPLGPYGMVKEKWERLKAEALDTAIDIPPTRKLAYLAADHGLLMNGAHRSLMDVLTTGEIIRRAGHKALIERARSPRLTFEAKVSYNDRGLAKAAGYRWNGDKKKWLKDGRLIDREETLAQAATLGFEVANEKTGEALSQESLPLNEGAHDPDYAGDPTSHC